MVDPNCYKLVSPTNVTDYSPCYVALFDPINQFNQSLESRKLRFISSINNWITTHQEIGYLKIPSITQIIEKHSANTSKSSSPSKVLKPRLTLKNDSSKFQFKSRDEKTQSSKSNGLSLLERIKLKEQQSKQQKQQETPEAQREDYLQGKLESIYNIIYQINGEQNKPTSFTLTGLTQIVKDSLHYPTHEEDIQECLELLAKRLNHAIIITTRGGLSVVKVMKLDREGDLESLKSNKTVHAFYTACK
ncbi:hypothetical protein PSN45_000315 [Yamadazyma tenuis]|nr:hypothetical protein PSN45_000315 [Yamadazyma tenuis]